MPEDTSEWAVARRAVEDAYDVLPAVLDRLAALSDPTRLQLLIAIHAAPGLPVKALAEATGLTPNTATQALEKLRNSCPPAWRATLAQPCC